MSRRTIPLLLFLLLLLSPLTVSGQADDPAGDAGQTLPAERLRVGVVLGGGGARGAAHVGVLRELERMQVPIDAIVGTSMGAIIGGLYAAGMTPAELEKLVTELDWSDPLQDTSARENLTYRRKQDDIEFPVNFEMGLGDGRLLLPKGLVFGQKLELLMRELTVAVAHIDDFDDLPTPFRAIAADLETGDTVVIGAGDLPRAMRASMSVPGIFAPVVMEGRTLVDGGLRGNVPVAAVQAMDVDVIIAVDVEFPLYTGEQLQSAVDVTAQMLTILIRKETRRQLDALDEDDVLIRPELGDFGSTNFGGVTETIEPGAEATRAAADRLRELAVDRQAYERYLAERQVTRPDPGIEINFIRIDDAGPLSARVLQARLETAVGEAVTSAELAQDAAQLYGLDLYEQVTYRLMQDGDLTGVEFTTVPKSWGPNFLQFGLSLEDDFEGSTAFNLSARLTRAGMNALGAEWRTDLQVGTEPYLDSEFYQPLDYDSRYFVAPQVRLEQSNFNAFAGDMSIARYRVSEAEAALDLGRELGRWGELRLGVYRGTGTARVTVGDPSLPNIDFQTGGVTASLGIDTLDDGQFPHEGTRLESTVTLSRPGFGADSSFDLVELNATKVWTRGRHSLQAGAEFGTTIRSDDLIQNFFPLGGFLRLSGLERGEISGPHAGLARLVWYRRSGETGSGVFEIPLYFGASLEAGGVWADRSDVSTESMILNGSLFAGLDSWLGPVYLAAGFAEDGDTSLYLFLGAPPR